MVGRGSVSSHSLRPIDARSRKGWRLGLGGARGGSAGIGWARAGVGGGGLGLGIGSGIARGLARLSPIGHRRNKPSAPIGRDGREGEESIGENHVGRSSYTGITSDGGAARRFGASSVAAAPWTWGRTPVGGESRSSESRTVLGMRCVHDRSKYRRTFHDCSESWSAANIGHDELTDAAGLRFC